MTYTGGLTPDDIYFTIVSESSLVFVTFKFWYERVAQAAVVTPEPEPEPETEIETEEEPILETEEETVVETVEET